MVVPELFACASASDSPKAMRSRTVKGTWPLQLRTNKVPTNDRLRPSSGIIALVFSSVGHIDLSRALKLSLRHVS